jgi:phosphoribosylglycinamide formyltransferase-1
LQTFEPDWIVSAGFMRILGAQVLASYPMRIINSHPSLLPAFPGADAVGDALAHGVKVTGCTIHLVDEGVDTGPILSQVAVNIEANQTKEQLHEQIKIQERSELVKVVANLCEGRLKLDGRRATFQ